MFINTSLRRNYPYQVQGFGNIRLSSPHIPEGTPILDYFIVSPYYTPGTRRCQGFCTHSLCIMTISVRVSLSFCIRVLSFTQFSKVISPMTFSISATISSLE